MTDASCTLSQSDQAIRELILNSKKFLKIITFRFDSKELADLIMERAKQIDVEVITNPPDNVAKAELRPLVETMYKELEAHQVKMNLCFWEAGDPRLTPTSVSGNQSAGGIGEKWYSLHLQMLINENEALVTSRPLTSDDTIDVFYRSSECTFLKSALFEFERIRKIFLGSRSMDDLTLPGEIINFLDQKMLKETIDLFKATGRLNAKQYDVEKLPKPALDKGLFLSPFDGKMRDLLYSFIDSADEHIYFFLETFFDEELIGKLQEKIARNPDIVIKIITSPPERIRQSPQKARELITQALSLGIYVGNLPNIQAKFWISDKWLAISSGDFNRMNLGHNTSSRYWKADTQLLLLENNKNLLAQTKNIFEEMFAPIDEGKICEKNVTVLVKRMAKNSKLSGTADACKYMSRFKSALMIKTEQDVRYVIDVAVRLAKLDNKSKLDGAYILMSIIIYYMQRREQTLDEIAEKLEGIEDKGEVKKIIVQMEQRGQLVKSGEYYRIAPNIGASSGTAQRNMSQF